MLGSGDGASPRLDHRLLLQLPGGDFYLHITADGFPSSSPQVPQDTVPKRPTPSPLPAPFPFGTRPHSLSKPCLLPPGSLLSKSSPPARKGSGYGLAGAWGKGHPHISVGDRESLTDPRHPLVERVESGERRQSLGRKSGQRGVSWWEELPKEAATWGAAHPHREGSLSHPKNHTMDRKGWHMQQAPMGLVNKAGEGGEGDTGLSAGVFLACLWPRAAVRTAKVTLSLGPQFLAHDVRVGTKAGMTKQSCQELCLQKVMSWGMSVQGAGCATPEPLPPQRSVH